MSKNGSSADIDESASRWVARVDTAPLSPAEREEFEAWLKESPRHRGAYARTQAILIAAEQARAAESPPDSPAAAVSDERPLMSRRRLLYAGGGIAGAAAAIAGVAFVRTYEAPFTHHRSRQGEVRQLPFDDGSVATLNTNTEIAVRLTRSRREIQLIRGEALFVVARDRARPFTVSARDAIVRAVGTSFTVRNLEDEPPQVLVGEGMVDMYRQSAPDEQPLRVPANARAAALEVPFPTVKMLDENLDPAVVARQLAWRQGMISFDGQSLKQAASEFARYSDMRIVIDDPVVANLKVIGLFSAYNPVEFAHSAAAILNLQVRETPNSVMLYR